MPGRPVARNARVLTHVHVAAHGAQCRARLLARLIWAQLVFVFLGFLPLGLWVNVKVLGAG